MIFLPFDIFTPFIKGRELAIDKNFEDLKRTNDVERQWLDNDGQWIKNSLALDGYQTALDTADARKKNLQLTNDITAGLFPEQLTQARLANQAAELGNQNKVLLNARTASENGALFPQNGIAANIASSQLNALFDNQGLVDDYYSGSLVNNLSKGRAIQENSDPWSEGQAIAEANTIAANNQVLNQQYNQSVLAGAIQNPQGQTAATGGPSPVRGVFKLPYGEFDESLVMSQINPKLAEGQRQLIYLNGTEMIAELRGGKPIVVDPNTGMEYIPQAGSASSIGIPRL